MLVQTSFLASLTELTLCNLSNVAPTAIVDQLIRVFSTGHPSETLNSCLVRQNSNQKMPTMRRNQEHHRSHQQLSVGKLAPV